MTRLSICSSALLILAAIVKISIGGLLGSYASAISTGSVKSTTQQLHEKATDEILPISPPHAEEPVSFSPIRWVQKVCHLEDTLQFYLDNFKLEIVDHKEYPGTVPSEAESSLAAYSRTILAPRGEDRSNSFRLELLYSYGTNRYRRGNDLRALVFSNSAFCGDPYDLKEYSPDEKFLVTPDNHLILIKDNNEDTLLKANNDVLKKKKNVIKFISLHVSNLAKSVRFYKNVLKANIAFGALGTKEEYSAFCIWGPECNLEDKAKANNDIQSKSNESNITDKDVEEVKNLGLETEIKAEMKKETESEPETETETVGIELVELPDGERMDLRESNGLFVLTGVGNLFDSMKFHDDKIEETGTDSWERIFSEKVYNFRKNQKGLGRIKNNLFKNNDNTNNGDENNENNVGKNDDNNENKNILISDPDRHMFLVSPPKNQKLENNLAKTVCAKNVNISSLFSV